MITQDSMSIANNKLEISGFIIHLKVNLYKLITSYISVKTYIFI